MTDNNHKLFLKHLSDSDEAVWKVARAIWNSGQIVTVNKAPRANTHGDWKQAVDQGDLMLGLRIEVKQRSVYFSCREDWPHQSFIVCAKHSFDNSMPKPFVYIVLSKCGEYAGMVYTKSKPLWWVEERNDHRYENVSQMFYICNLSVVEFIKLSDIKLI